MDCCNRKMKITEFCLRSETAGCKYDYFFQLICKNEKCGLHKGYVVRERNDGKFSDDGGLLTSDEVRKYERKIDKMLVTRNDNFESRAMVHASEGTVRMARDTAQIYKKVLKDGRRAVTAAKLN